MTRLPPVGAGHARDPSASSSRNGRDQSDAVVAAKGRSYRVAGTQERAG